MSLVLDKNDPIWAPLAAALSNAALENHLNIAYSGGFDSRFLAFCAKALGFEVTLWHVTGPHIPQQETQDALERAKEMALTVKLVPADPTRISDFVSAGRKRCYACKRAVFSTLLAMIEGDLCDGTNATDTFQYRPGEKALKELGVHSPWREGGYEKVRMRKIAATLGFPAPDQPSRPCLMTRFPYGMQPRRDLMALATTVECGLLKRYPKVALRCRFPDGLTPVVHVERASIRGLDEAAFLSELEEEIIRVSGISIPVEVHDVLSGYFDRIPQPIIPL